MKIGIPRALLYYKNEKMWTTFFEELGIEYIISPETNREIIKDGTNFAIDETCLPTKVLLGHVNWLIGKCDYIFLPRVAKDYGYDMCTKFLAQVDLVRNTFNSDGLKFLFYNIDKSKRKSELKAYIKMGKFLGYKKGHIKDAFYRATQTQLFYELFRTQNQKQILDTTTKNKVLVVAHAYNIGDKFIGEPIIKTLKSLDCEPIIAEYAPKKEAVSASKKVSSTMPWAYNRHLIGAIELYKDMVDGIILLTTFPCGPDSMVNETILHHYKDLPIIVLTLDTQDATAGIETRLESFVDIINFKKEKSL